MTPNCSQQNEDVLVKCLQTTGFCSLRLVYQEQLYCSSSCVHNFRRRQMNSSMHTVALILPDLSTISPYFCRPKLLIPTYIVGLQKQRLHSAMRCIVVAILLVSSTFTSSSWSTKEFQSIASGMILHHQNYNIVFFVYYKLLKTWQGIYERIFSDLLAVLIARPNRLFKQCRDNFFKRLLVYLLWKLKRW